MGRSSEAVSCPLLFISCEYPVMFHRIFAQAQAIIVQGPIQDIFTIYFCNAHQYGSFCNQTTVYVNLETKFVAYAFEIIYYQATTVAIDVRLASKVYSMVTNEALCYTSYYIQWPNPSQRLVNSIFMKFSFFYFFYNVLVRDGPGPRGPQIRHCPYPTPLRCPQHHFQNTGESNCESPELSTLHHLTANLRIGIRSCLKQV